MPKRNNKHPSNFSGFLKVHISVESIQRLLDTWPDAIREKDDDGRLTFHVALENPNVSLEMIQVLLDA